MITLKVECSMCGHPDSTEEMYIETIQDFTFQSLKKRLGKMGWTVQRNGDNIDTYCSPECSK